MVKLHCPNFISCAVKALILAYTSFPTLVTQNCIHTSTAILQYQMENKEEHINADLT